ncbi:MAG: MFS transporter [Pyrinomonadaceae bacterium]|nr:MFS transporter [Pyrinomonadaceae bacterium]
MDAGNTKNSLFFYGWIIVAICVLALIVSNGLSIGGIPVFYKFVQGDLVNSGSVPQDKIQSVYGLAPALTFLLAGFLSPVAGFLLQKFNARTMMLIGCVILGAGLIIYSQSTTPILVYLAHALLGTSLGFVGVLVSTVLVSNWFVKKRGQALGIVLTGTSFGGVLIPQIATPLIQAYGWRTAMILISLIIWLILLPAVVFLVKNRPSEIGLLPDGEEPIETTENEAKVAANSGMSLAEAIATPMFWVFSFCAAFIFYAIFVVSQQLNLYLQTPKIGFTPQQASNVQSLLFALSVVGKFLFGWLSDRFAGNRVMLISASTMFLATLFFLYFNSTTVYIFAILFGMNYGGTFVLLQLLVADYFGTKEYGKILGAVTVVETVGGALGTFLTGKIADANGGDYTQAFYGVTIVVGIAFVLVILLNLFLNQIRRPFWLLPIIFTPIIGALVGVIGGPVFNEVARVVFGGNIFNLVLPTIIIGLLIGLVVGIWSGLSVKKTLTA